MGNGVAVDLASKGWQVVILDWNHQQGVQAAKQIDGDFFAVDVRDWRQQFEAFQKVHEKYGRLDFGKLGETLTVHRRSGAIHRG